MEMIIQAPIASPKPAAKGTPSGPAPEREHLRKPHEEAGVMSFAHILGEEGERPASAHPVTEDKKEAPETLSEVPAEGTPHSKASADVASGPGVVTDGATAMIDPAVVEAVAPVNAGSATVAAADAADPPMAQSMAQGLGTVAAAGTATESLPAALTTATTPVDAEGVLKGATPQAPSTTKLTTHAPAVLIEGEGAPATSDSTAQPGVQLKAGSAKAPAAPVPAAATAQALESAAKAQDVYVKAPVVSEAQLLAGSLKQEHQAPVLSQPVPVNQTAKAEPAMGQAGAATLSAEQPEGEGPLVMTVQPEGPEQPEEAAADTKAQLPNPVGETSPTSDRPLPSAAKEEAPSGQATSQETPPTVTPEVALDRANGATVVKAAADAVVGTGVSRQVHSQVVRHFATELTEVRGNEKVVIKLNPEALGQIELKFEGRDDRLSVVMSASTPQAEAALRENMQDLSERIMERSARFNHVDVRIEVRDNGDVRHDQRSQDKNEGRQDQRRGQSEENSGGEQDDHPGQQGHHARAAQQSWEDAMSWQLAAEAATGEA